MAGTKRPLTQIDGNATRTSPAKKRATAAPPSPDKEDILLNLSKLKKAELKLFLQECGLPSSARTKEIQLRILSDHAEFVKHWLSKRGRGIDKAASVSGEHAAATQAALPAANSTLTLEWWTLCRPLDDIKQERCITKEDYDSGNEEEDENEEGDVQETQVEHASHGKVQARSVCGQKNCICKLPIEDHPEHKWVLTKKGYLNTARLQYEINIRDQDAIEEHFCNDFSGYGYEEAMENQV
jgi:hypothetical protein